MIYALFLILPPLFLIFYKISLKYTGHEDEYIFISDIRCLDITVCIAQTIFLVIISICVVSMVHFYMNTPMLVFEQVFWAAVNFSIPLMIVFHMWFFGKQRQKELFLQTLSGEL